MRLGPSLNPIRRTRRAWRGFAALAIVLAALGPAASTTVAAEGLTMEARILLNGNARIGSWMAIEVHLVNNGPAVTGELRLAGGSQGQTRFSRPVDLPTQSNKTEILYAQPKAFGSELEIVLASGEEVVASTKAKFSIHDTTQLVVAVVAEQPERIVGNLHLLPNQNQVAPLVMSITPDDLPERVEGWNMLDRIVWQDVDASRLSPGQIDSLRGWVAGGGQFVIAGGTAGPRISCGDPRRPAALPTNGDHRCRARVPRRIARRAAGRRDRPTGPVGRAGAGRALATVGDRVVAAERTYGLGQVTLLGFDPAAPWIGESGASDGLWRRLLPPRTAGGLVFADDNMLVSAVSQLPSLALPPVTGLIVLLGAYILLIGPDQLPGPEPDRSPRVGLGDHADPDRGLHGRGIRVRVRAARQRRHRQRDRDRRAAPPARPTGPRRSTSGSSRRRAAATRCACRAVRCSPRRSTTSSPGKAA